MKPVEHLWCYCQLKLHGYSHEEAKNIIDEINNTLVNSRNFTEEEAEKHEQVLKNMSTKVKKVYDV